MKYIIKNAKTVEEAINSSLVELNLNRDEVEIEIIEEGSKGLFGLIGTKDAKVKVTSRPGQSGQVTGVFVK